MVRFLCVSALVCTLWGCAAPQVATLPPEQLWQDAAFHYRAGQVEETAQTLLAMEPSIIAELRSHWSRGMSPQQRVRVLLGMLYGEQGIRLSYASGHTTGAMQTWRDKRGDCLSLTLLTYAVAKALGLQGVMQEVQVAPVFDRRADAEYVSRHVNVRIPTYDAVRIDGRTFESGSIVVDFQPQPGAQSRAVALTEDQMVARFYNNRATEYMAQGRDELAYAYYKAAIAADAHYGPAYSNLSQLYYRHGIADAAEKLLWHAAALDSLSDAPLRNLFTLLTAQGRIQEAQAVSARMERMRERDPYYWLREGVEALRQGSTRSAISALERAEELAIGFQEIHYYLAMAYLRNGQREKAVRQIAALDAIAHEDPRVAMLNKKLQGMGAKSAVF